MSLEQYEWKNQETPDENKRMIEKIKTRIYSPLMAEFSVELQRLTNPDHLVKDFIGLLKVKISSKFYETSYLYLFDRLLYLRNQSPKAT